MGKILVIAGGGKKHLELFVSEAEKQGVELSIASFSELEYLTKEGAVRLTVNGKDVMEYNLVYIRLVGKRLEEAALLINYCKKAGLKIVDTIFEKGISPRVPLPKSIETELLVAAGIPVPKTYFGSLKNIKENAPEVFGFPFVIKGTTGKQGHAVWSPRNMEELNKLVSELAEKEKEGNKFIAQEFIRASQRVRVLVVGRKAIAAITRPTRWRRRFVKKVNGDDPPGKREPLKPIPEADAQLAVEAANSLYIDIAGVDILHEDESGKAYVLEVNAAPRWASISQDCEVNVEAEIVSFLKSWKVESSEN